MLFSTQKKKTMKKSILIQLFLFCLSTLIFGQTEKTISGKVTSNSGDVLSYVNIGIIGTSIGTVSATDGTFTLYLKKEVTTLDTLRFSIIGYDSQSFALSETSETMDVTLKQSIFDLEEILVKPNFTKSRTTGRSKVKGNRNVNFSIGKKPRQNLGAEIGKKFNVKKKLSQIEQLRFYIRTNNFKEVKFRILFYNIKKGKPHKLLTDQDIIVTITDKQTGWITVDLTQYELLTKKNFIATLQWIDASDDGKYLAMPISFPVFGKHHYYKFGSQAKWKHFRNMSVSMDVRLGY